MFVSIAKHSQRPPDKGAVDDQSALGNVQHGANQGRGALLLINGPILGGPIFDNVKRPGEYYPRDNQPERKRVNRVWTESLLFSAPYGECQGGRNAQKQHYAIAVNRQALLVA